MNTTTIGAELPPSAVAFIDTLTTSFQSIPGSSIVIRYIRSSYQNDPVRSAVELFLFIFAVRYLLAPTYSTKKTKNVPLSEDEIDELVEDWTPEPLASEESEWEKLQNEKLPVIVGPAAAKARLQNGKTVTNLASYNHYGFANNPELTTKAVATVRTYGVGPCSPPGFYGTQDVHMKSEADIAAHLGVDAAIIYAQSFSTISSVIPAFSKRGDIIVADKAVNFPIRKGLQISRSTVRWYEHNDMEDLERVLAKVVKEGSGKALTRRFIVTEGLFENVGDMVNLPKIIELKDKYKFRVILDETWSYGVLGRTGKGVTEQQNVDPLNVDMIIGGLAGAMSSGGGFCAGTTEIVEHQRLSASAYTFSAALPALLATTASETVTLLQEDPNIIKNLRENIAAMRAQLDPRSDWIRCMSAPENPVMLLTLKEQHVKDRVLSRADQEFLLQDCVDECLANGVLITRLKSMPPALGTQPRELDKEWQPFPALKVCVTGALSRKETEKAGIVIRHAITSVMKGKKWQTGRNA
ncbi:Serine palmitoyltransferase 1 [Fulvia fulva]|uniref:serine C-palmitoyltransferase n=1 Tax=Passalora fulva TaxID=5499 RepID=A0A9Q8PJ58_PASFU|nr:Serine palmitoyltransferase 1 [Fulvia fulva]KAK4612062.1 Serine palmitoyltransferase 1 [Fulvia fulva]KAK4612700.1 Serine palmitoyltransferase 1 [Fulvia fulva]UJO23433.1 Serine palmitoyltransferase 1 [Fulvia fulva]WPV21120.1 Serine palmitoyltransferase 1 [Fulvia fulva]WPV36426.1 Serine palmitoyltransferase 1 [Fulvia fulva]